MRFITNADANNMQLVQVEPRGPSQLIEVPVTVGGVSKINFPDIANLRNQGDQIIIIKGVRLITAAVLTNGPLTGLVTSPDTELQKISLVLYSEGWEKGQLIPIFVLNDMVATAGNATYRQLPTKFDSWMNLDWNKSFLQYSNGTSSNVGAGNYCVMLDVEYVKMRKSESGALVEIIGPN